MNFDFHISKEKLDLARMVKKGKAGDSLYAKNLLSLFWEPEVLENRSVTGRKANSVKDAVPKPRLTPKKLDELKSKLFWFSFSFIHFIYITIVLTILELIDMKKKDTISDIVHS